MDALLDAICQINKTDSGIKCKKISTPGDRTKHCEFTSGGDIHLQKGGKL